MVYAAQKAINKQGKLRIYFSLASPMLAKLQIAKDAKGGVQAHVPVLLEVCNPSAATKVIRDVTMSLRKDGKDVFPLSQTTKIQGEDPVIGRILQDIGGENGSYSFFIPPNEIVSKWFLFASPVPSDKRAIEFDEIALYYHDQKDRKFRISLLKLTSAAKLDGSASLRHLGHQWTTARPIKSRK